MDITPEYIVDINTNLESLATSNWQRVMRAAGGWSRLMKKRSDPGKIITLTWLLDTAGIYPQGDGGNIRFDDMASAQTELIVSDFGSGLLLTSNELKDNQMNFNPKMRAMDFVKKWSKDRGGEMAYFPRKNLFAMILANPIAYDGLSLFNANHPVDPANPGGAVYSNIISGVDVSQGIITGGSAAGSINDVATAAELFSIALAKISGLQFVGGTPRFLVPRVVACATPLGYRFRQLTGNVSGTAEPTPAAKLLAMTDNVLEQYKIEVMEAPELNASTQTTYYIGVEDILSDELGAFVMNENEAFNITGYPDTQSAAQNRSRTWEWHLHGRYGFMPGHPYLIFKCTV